MSCQLSTLFSCNCVNCLGGYTTSTPSTNTTYYTTQDSIEDLYQLQCTTTISAAVSVVSNQHHTDETSSNHNQEEEEERAKFSSTSSSVDEKEVEENNKPQQEEEIQQQQEQTPKKLTRRQRRQQHTKSFLDVARSLRDSPKLFRNKPAHVCASVNFHSEEANRYFLERCNEQYKQERRRFKRLRRRQYLPSWCYEKNDNSLRSLRELVCVFVGGEEEYKIIDKRATNATWRLPRSTALAHKFKNRWIVRHRIFNCKAPFSNVFNWSDDATLNKSDTRGQRQRETDEKFCSKDGRERYNRNGGHHRRSYRANHYHQGKQIYMGNSRKSMFGKPWLFCRQAKIFKGKDRVAEFDF